jgi:hypothetical protein
VRIQFEPNNQGSNAATTAAAMFDISIDQIQIY